LIKELNVRSETIKLLEENTGRMLLDINCSNIFVELTLRVMEIKIIINKWDLIILKSFCTAKETTNKMKRLGENIWVVLVFKHELNYKLLQ